MPEGKERGLRSTCSHCALHVALIVALFFVSALVIKFFSATKTKRDLSLASPEIQLERDQRESLSLDRADHLADLPLVKEELPRPRWIVVEVARLLIR